MKARGVPFSWSVTCAEPEKKPERGKRPTPYESLLVTISQAVRGGKLPAGWYQVPVTKETLQAPAGLSSVADAVWTGNHLKMVRFAVENKTLSALNIRESDFWQREPVP